MGPPCAIDVMFALLTSHQLLLNLNSGWQVAPPLLSCVARVWTSVNFHIPDDYSRWSWRGYNVLMVALRQVVANYTPKPKGTPAPDDLIGCFTFAKGSTLKIWKQSLELQWLQTKCWNIGLVCSMVDMETVGQRACSWRYLS